MIEEETIWRRIAELDKDYQEIFSKMSNKHYETMFSQEKIEYNHQFSILTEIACRKSELLKLLQV